MSSLRYGGSKALGFTLIEVIVGATIATMLTLSLVGTVTIWLGQYAVGSIREQQVASIDTALSRINDDIRQSTSVLAQNATTDANAPASPGYWASGTSQLVLAKTPRDASGNGLYDVGSLFSGTPDSIVYYLKNGTLYRRVVPANYTGNVTSPIISCTVDPAGGCAGDTPLLSNVTQVQFTYYDSSNNSSATPTDTKSVAVSLSIGRQQSGQTITTSDNTRMSLQSLATFVPPPSTGGSPPPLPQLTPGLMVGPGGLQAGFANITGHDIYVKGQLIMQYLSTISTGTYRFDVANIGCGTRTTFPATCTGQQPISVSFGSTAAGSPICGTGQTVTTGLTGLQAGCTASSSTFPAINKGNYTSSMTSTITGDVGCGFFGSQSIAAKTKITGSINVSYCNNLTIGGDTYVNGDFISSGSTIRVAEGIITRPVIIVNGKVNFSSTNVEANSAGVTPYIISFYSTNSTCSASATCTSIANTDMYDTLTSSATAVNLSYLSNIAASVYAYFGTMNVSTTNITGAIAGQKVILGSNSGITLAQGVWPS